MTAQILLARCPAAAHTTRRAAVKAVARAQEMILLLRSGVDGHFKFPGGGLHPEEGHAEALARELREECGRDLVRLGAPLVTVVERRPDQDRPAAVFEMTSTYYDCDVTEPLTATRMDDYERELDLTPVWTRIEIAAAANENLASAAPSHPWLEREIAVMRWLAAEDRR